jgi:hypothetical protein
MDDRLGISSTSAACSPDIEFCPDYALLVSQTIEILPSHVK